MFETFEGKHVRIAIHTEPAAENDKTIERNSNVIMSLIK